MVLKGKKINGKKYKRNLNFFKNQLNEHKIVLAY
jgi:hypothetical protein